MPDVDVSVDWLGRGLESVRASEGEIAKAARRGWRARLFSRPNENAAGTMLAALKKGYEMGLERRARGTAELVRAQQSTALGRGHRLEAGPHLWHGAHRGRVATECQGS